MSGDLDRFYAALGRLATLPGQGRALRDHTGRSHWPRRGVYFFHEPGELRATGGADRVVRVGTHALSTGSGSHLWGRLRAHRGSEDGRGNHRGSIFRLHVGAAMLKRDGNAQQVPSWGIGQSAPRAVRDEEVTHERAVSSHIGRMGVLWVAVLDDPGPRSLRGYIERNAIALLANGLHPVDPPSETWLGRWSPRREIRMSGLWNLNHVSETYDPAFLEHLETLIHHMESEDSVNAP